MVGGDCLTKLTVLDDDIHPSNKAYKVYDGTYLTEIVHIDTAGCADDEIAISDTSEPTGWKCGPGSSLWTENGSDIYFNTGKVGIGTNLPTSTLDVVVGIDTPGASIGQGTAATGAFAVAMGLNVTAQPYSSTVIGRYNVVSGNGTSWVMTDPLFVVGNGTGDLDRSNAMTILKNGNVGIDVDNPTVPLHVGDGPDCTLASGGIILTNMIDSSNLCIDREGIMARANGANSDLNIQSEGGRTLFNGDVLIGTTSHLLIGTTVNPSLSPLRVSDGTYDVDLLGTSFIFGTVGVVAKGSIIGGLFSNASDNDTRAFLSSGNIGVQGVGKSKGGLFKDSDNTSSVDLAYGSYGIMAYGDFMGGYFKDSSTNIYSWVGYDVWSLYGSGKIRSFSTEDVRLDTALSGALVLGSTSGKHLNIDGNEIMASDGTATSKLYLQSNGGAVYVGGSQVHASDLRLKEDIEDLDYDLDDILSLRPVSFNWKNQVNEKKSLGFIAQEVEPIISEVVYDHAREDDPTMLGINYDSLVPVAIKAIQELKAEKDAEIAELKSIVCELKPDAEICN